MYELTPAYVEVERQTRDVADFVVRFIGVVDDRKEPTGAWRIVPRLTCFEAIVPSMESQLPGGQRGGNTRMRLQV